MRGRIKAEAAKRLSALFVSALLLLPAAGLTAEGGAMLSQDDLSSLAASYETFLSELCELLLARGLLSEGEREAWMTAQLGDYYANGGYGSFLITYQPGALGYVREEDMTAQLSCRLGEGILSLSTMRRYTPGYGEEGLRLSFSLSDSQGMPVSCSLQLTASDGMFSRWDPLTSQYVSVGASAATEGETLLWIAGTPAPGAKDPEIAVRAYDAGTGEELGAAILILKVSDGGYEADADGLSGIAGP